MIKKYLLIILVFSFSFQGIAQKFNGGVMLGLAASQVAGDQRGGFNKAGVYAGGWINLNISPKSLLQMELAYSQKGSRENQDFDRGIESTYIMRLGYVELPLLYKYVYNEKFEFETGLAMNFLIHQGETLDGYATVDNPFKAQNLCFIAGIGIHLTEKIKIIFRTDNSLFSIRKDRVSGDVWRFWGHGQFSDALILSAYYKL